MRLLLNIICMGLVLFSTAALAFDIDTALPDAAQESRAKALFRDIRCVVCQGESIADSPAQIAGDMRRAVREQIAAGASNDDILNELTSHYGNVIRMKPPFNPATLFLWCGPALILAYAAWLARSLFFPKKPAQTP